MAMLIYTTGNGYSCGCCRQTNREFVYFEEDEQSIANLVRDCIEISRCAKGDFSIDTIEGYSGDADELEKRITAAISQAEAEAERRKQIGSLTQQIKEIDNWFSTLDAAKEEKTTRRQRLTEDLQKATGA